MSEKKLFGLLIVLLISLILVKAEDISIEKYIVLNQYDPDQVYVPSSFYVGVFSSTSQGNKIARTLLKFDISSLENKKIDSAILRIEAKIGQHGTTPNLQVLEVYKVIEYWDDATWNAQPDYGSTVEDSVIVTTSGEYSLDITNLVQKWIIKQDSNFGIVLKAQNEQEFNLKEFIRNYQIITVHVVGELTECEIKGGNCKSSCGAGEEKKSYDCDTGYDCCFEIGNPDLTVSGIRFVNAGTNSYNIYAKFANIGKSSSGPYGFKAYVNDNPIEFIAGNNLQSLDPGQNIEVVLGTRAVNMEDSIHIIIDPEKKIEEEDEDNNEIREIVYTGEYESNELPPEPSLPSTPTSSILPEDPGLPPNPDETLPSELPPEPGLPSTPTSILPEDPGLPPNPNETEPNEPTSLFGRMRLFFERFIQGMFSFFKNLWSKTWS